VQQRAFQDDRRLLPEQRDQGEVAIVERRRTIRFEHNRTQDAAR
jgi:hypothetical protein